MNLVLTFIGGAATGTVMKQIINWVDVDNFKINHSNLFLEIISGLLWLWAFANLPLEDATIFSLISSVLIGIGYVDYFTMQIPLILILIGLVISLIGIVVGSIYLSASLWGIFVGAIIPLIIMGITYLITKRQGMGFGDIQMGIVLGTWLGPMRMALTLFGASVLSLLTWIAVSLLKDFDKDRALPMAPFLAIAGIGVYIGSFYFPGFFHLLIIQ